MIGDRLPPIPAKGMDPHELSVWAWGAVTTAGMRIEPPGLAGTGNRCWLASVSWRGVSTGAYDERPLAAIEKLVRMLHAKEAGSK